MKHYPFISLAQALVILRLAVALFFFAHAAVRVIDDTIPQFSAYLSNKGWPFSTAIVWSITLFELIGSVLLVLNWRVKYIVPGFLFIVTMGIAIIHINFGWFVGEHGTGGSEYSVSLLVSLLVLAAADNRAELSAHQVAD